MCFRFQNVVLFTLKEYLNFVLQATESKFLSSSTKPAAGFHHGDVPYIATIRRLLGIVGWVREETQGSGDNTHRPSGDNVSVCGMDQNSASRFSTARLSGQFLIRKLREDAIIKKLSDLDWVYCGQPFADRTGMDPSLPDSDSDDDCLLTGTAGEIISRVDFEAILKLKSNLRQQKSAASKKQITAQNNTKSPRKHGPRKHDRAGPKRNRTTSMEDPDDDAPLLTCEFI